MNKLRILIIDDDPQFRNLTKLNLEQTGIYDVVLEGDSEKAVSAMREHKPDLLLLDIVMPGLDGGDVRALMKADPELNKIPVLIISAVVSEAEADDTGVIYSAGDPVLPKTATPDILLHCIEGILAGKI